MTTLLLADHDNSRLDPQTAQALTAALALGQPVHILVAGQRLRRGGRGRGELSSASSVSLSPTTRATPPGWPSRSPR